MSWDTVFVKLEPVSDDEECGEVEISKPSQNLVSQPVTVSVQPEFICIKQELPENDENGPSEIVEPLHPGAVVKTELGALGDNPPGGGESEYKPSGFMVEIDVMIPPAQAQSFDYQLSDEDISAMVSPTTGKFECPVCRTQVSTKNNFQRHLLRHTGHKVACHICGHEFLNNNCLNRHIKNQHSRNKTYECPICKQVFPSSSERLQHKKTHNKPLTCEICYKTFTARASLVKHQGTARCKKPVTLFCNVCHKQFFQDYLLRSHLLIHTTEKQFECDHCGVKFKYKSTITRHVQRHIDFKPHPCKICGKKFSHYGLMKPHMRSHTGVKPYSCPICPKKFSHKHNMQRHAINHNKVKHLVCEVCHREFPKESRLKYHMRMHMADIRPFKCDHCPKSFSHRQNIMRHYKKKHPNQVYDRPDTDASFAQAIWQEVMKRNKEEPEKQFILPENEPDFSVTIVKEEREE